MLVALTICFQNGEELSVGKEMLLAWGSNYQHDKGSVHSCDLELLCQLKQVIQLVGSKKKDVDKAIEEYMVS
jgi:hypothetical protein